MSNILFFDVESTGLDDEKHSIIQLAAQYYQNGTKTHEFETAVCPYTESVSIGALKTNKFSPHDLYSGENSHDACANFVEFLLQLPNWAPRYNPITVGAHNAKFDLGMVRNFLEAHNYTNLDEIFSHRVVDTAATARFLIDSGVLDCKSASLGTVAKALGLDVDENKQHEALYDTELCARVYFAMIDLVRGNLNLEPQVRNWS